MRIDILDLQGVVALDKKKIKETAEIILKSMAEDDTELSLTFVSDIYIKRLNQKYRNENSATDVLAFSIRGDDSSFDKCQILGDVVISIETAKRESKCRKIPLENELSLYIIHGILHLLGYNDVKVNDRKKMKLKEQELLCVLEENGILNKPHKRTRRVK